MKYKPTKDNIRKWIIALRSDKFKQTTDHLENNGKYCCLGVACKIFIPESKQKLVNDKLYGAAPYAQPHAPKWLQEVNFLPEGSGALSDLNDRANFSFDEIADILQLIYLEGILD